MLVSSDLTSGAAGAACGSLAARSWARPGTASATTNAAAMQRAVGVRFGFRWFIFDSFQERLSTRASRSSGGDGRLLTEREDLGVDGIGICRRHAVRKTLVRFQRAVLQ